MMASLFKICFNYINYILMVLASLLDVLFGFHYKNDHVKDFLK